VSETPKNPMQELWLQQPLEGTRMSLDEIRKRASKFEKRIVRRNAREYVCGGIAIFLFGYFLAHAHDMPTRIAFGMLIAGMAYVMVYLYRKGGTTGAAAAETGKQCTDFFLRELERQRDLMSNLWWYLGPLVPGMVMLSVSSFLAPRRPYSLWVLAAVDVSLVVLSYVIIRMNSRAARCLQRQIDELRAARAAQS
jgi:hypothetical protein